MPELTVRELADLCGAELDGDGDRVIVGPASLLLAGPREVSFLAHPKYERQLAETSAGAVLVSADVVSSRADLTVLRCADPGSAFSRVVEAFAEPSPRPPAGVHPAAWVDPTAELADDASVGPLCCVGPGARIGAGAVLHAGVHVGAGASVGGATVLHPGVVLYPRVAVGSRCLLHGGTVVGADGFGFEPSADGWVKVPQCGTVVIEDEVEIGAGCTIDRGRFGATRIGRGSKLDNQVHVGHNVEVGERSLLVAQVGLAGSARLGPGVLLGGQVGVAGHAEIGSRARVAGGSAVYGDLPGGRDYLGSPAQPRQEELRRMALARRLPALLERLRELEKRLADLEARP